MAEISATFTPRLPKLWAMLRATPPGVKLTLPGLEVPAIYVPPARALMSIFAPPMTMITGHQKSVGAPPSRLRRSTKASSSSRMAGSIGGLRYSASACF